MPEKITVISHADSDGVLAVATFIKYLTENKFNPEVNAYFTSPAHLLDTISISLFKKEKIFKEICIFDFSGRRESLCASAVYEHAYWFDHHQWEKISGIPKNVKLFVDSSLPSAVSVINKFLKFHTEFEKYANEIDTNAVATKEAERIRDIVSAWKYKSSGMMLNTALITLAKKLAANGIEEIFNPTYDHIIAEYKKWLSQTEKSFSENLNIYRKGNLKICVVYINEPIPIFHIFNVLKIHAEAPFDILVVVTYNEKNNSTKLEFRTYTDKNVFALAKVFGGGGHKVASGALVYEKITSDELLSAIDLVKI